jgi:hypothetical protein
VFIAVLFINVKNWKQPKWLSIGEWVNKLWYMYTLEYYSAIARNELSNKIHKGKIHEGNLKFTSEKVS